mgnify:CR=1 FL=1
MTAVEITAKIRTVIERVQRDVPTLQVQVNPSASPNSSAFDVSINGRYVGRLERWMLSDGRYEWGARPAPRMYKVYESLGTYEAGPDDAGQAMDTLMGIVASKGLEGFMFFMGLPASVGEAIEACRSILYNPDIDLDMKRRKTRHISQDLLRMATWLYGEEAALMMRGEVDLYLASVNGGDL